MPSPLINFILLVLSLLLTVFGAARSYTNQVPLMTVLMLFLGAYGLGMTFPTFLARLRGPASQRQERTARAAPPRRTERRQRPQRKERSPRSERRPRSKSEKPKSEKPAKRVPRVTGTVKWFDESKGYGFITPENGGKDCFVHRSVLPNGGSLAEGKRVEFEVIKDDRGREAAANVVLL